MEEGPNQDRKILNHEEALALAEADPEGWKEAQVWTLDDHLVGQAERQLDPQTREIFQRRLRASGRSLEELLALGDEYKLTPDFDLQTESLKVYCRWQGAEYL